MSSLAIPTLHTPRLILEPLDRSHTSLMFELWSNDEVCRYSGRVHDAHGKRIPTPVRTRRDGERVLEFWLDAQAAGRGLRWALAIRDEQRHVGTIGFNSLGPSAELAYHLHPGAWGRGLIAEAGAAALAWLDEREDSCEAVAYVEDDNTRSIATALRLGFHPTDTLAEGARCYVRTARADGE